MKAETLKKANALQERIDDCNSLLKSQQDTYYWCAVNVTCGNSNTGPDHHGCIPRDIWNKMLDVLERETQKLQKELDAL